MLGALESTPTHRRSSTERKVFWGFALALASRELAALSDEKALELATVSRSVVPHSIRMP